MSLIAANERILWAIARGLGYVLGMGGKLKPVPVHVLATVI